MTDLHRIHQHAVLAALVGRIIQLRFATLPICY
jgi:hypothetical protein